MSAGKCAICGKTAYPLESLSAIDKTFHKICFRCDTCSTPLSIKNFKGYQGKIYCHGHMPVERSSTGADSVTAKVALNAPKKVAEGLGTAQKGTGEAPNVGLDSMGTQNALKAPKAKAEGLGTAQKGTGEAPNVGLDSMGTQNALKAPKAVAEGLNTAHKGHHSTAPKPVAITNEPNLGSSGGGGDDGGYHHGGGGGGDGGYEGGEAEDEE